MNPSQLNTELNIESSRLAQNNIMNKNKFDPENPEGSVDESDNDKPQRRSGRRKIKIEYIEDKNRRHITFSKRKAGIMKKAYELSTLTGTQVLLLVVSETGLVYTFTTVKLQPIVTKPEGKNLIQACLNAPDPISSEQSNAGDASYNNTASPREEERKPTYEDKKLEVQPPKQTAAPSGYGVNPSAPAYQSQPYQQPPQSQQLPSQPSQQSQQPPQQSSSGSNQISVNSSGYGGHPGYMSNNQGNVPQSYQPSSQPPPPNPQQHYAQMPQPSYYSNQQSHYMPHQQQQHPGYWQPPQNASNNSLPRQDLSPTMDDKARRGHK
ncbi:hypothetical protein BDB01DRAFT_795759 [Pilobolus umbonatus]|nr:hypothetical protein BDB01DRAFT_795742 [Pilobolus umbonatus]KAI8980830.1 hypothetical protein BDB01DRAFT_795759 [Pilobolus umbonatus]